MKHLRTLLMLAALLVVSAPAALAEDVKAELRDGTPMKGSAVFTQPEGSEDGPWVLDQLFIDFSLAEDQYLVVEQRIKLRGDPETTIGGHGAGDEPEMNGGVWVATVADRTGDCLFLVTGRIQEYEYSTGGQGGAVNSAALFEADYSYAGGAMVWLEINSAAEGVNDDFVTNSQKDEAIVRLTVTDPSDDNSFAFRVEDSDDAADGDGVIKFGNALADAQDVAEVTLGNVNGVWKTMARVGLQMHTVGNTKLLVFEAPDSQATWDTADASKRDSVDVTCCEVLVVAVDAQAGDSDTEKKPVRAIALNASAPVDAGNFPWSTGAKGEVKAKVYVKGPAREYPITIKNMANESGGVATVSTAFGDASVTLSGSGSELVGYSEPFVIRGTKTSTSADDKDRIGCVWNGSETQAGEPAEVAVYEFVIELQRRASGQYDPAVLQGVGGTAMDTDVTNTPMPLIDAEDWSDDSVDDDEKARGAYMSTNSGEARPPQSSYNMAHISTHADGDWSVGAMAVGAYTGDPESGPDDIQVACTVYQVMKVLFKTKPSGFADGEFVQFDFKLKRDLNINTLAMTDGALPTGASISVGFKVVEVGVQASGGDDAVAAGHGEWAFKMADGPSDDVEPGKDMLIPAGVKSKAGVEGGLDLVDTNSHFESCIKDCPDRGVTIGTSYGWASFGLGVAARRSLPDVTLEDAQLLLAPAVRLLLEMLGETEYPGCRAIAYGKADKPTVEIIDVEFRTPPTE